MCGHKSGSTPAKALYPASHYSQ
ncbi:hypothetical protein SBA1_1340018 [Candidatus Sulfotelmatobacter kueseliae]|uniref:Uncharacterized protein n=1 Tax=Candidatus Sulfotelmatobacter kueseliae TaxID=2042962 RepID=A0A2U3K553_9BACT|nr:hypothetical protein SBA1_1340018 [Candidatus Sulfotelmatobacter kueseliae]